MTANILQSVIPRTRSDFRSALRWTATPTRRQHHTSQIANLAFRSSQQLKFSGQAMLQRGSISPNTLTLSLGLMALSVIALLGFFYLQQVITTASQGGDINTLETKISDLHEQQRQLELQGAQLRSLQTIENKVQKLNLVTSDKVAYLANTSDKVAVNTAALPH